MPARVQRFEPVVHINFFGGLNPREEALAFVSFEFTAIQIDAVFRVDPVAMLLKQPIHAVGCAPFFVGGKRDDQMLVRKKTFLFEPDEIGDEDGIAFFHVIGSAAVEITILLDELERIGGPVLTMRLDHIEVADEQDGLAISHTAETRDEILFPLVRAGHPDVAFRKPRVTQAAGHRFRRSGHVADGVRSIDFNELLENVARQLPGLLPALCPSAKRAAHHQTKQQDPAILSAHSLSSIRIIRPKALDSPAEPAAPSAHHEGIATDTMRSRTTESCRSRGPAPET